MCVLVGRERERRRRDERRKDRIARVKRERGRNGISKERSRRKEKRIGERQRGGCHA